MGLNHLITLINEAKISPDVIFIDPLYMSMLGSLSDDLAARATGRNIRRLGKLFGASIVLVHHEHRPVRRQKDSTIIDEGDNAVMGSFVWKAFVNHLIQLRLRQDKLRELSCSTQRNCRVIENMELELVQPNPLYYRIWGTADYKGYIDTVLNFTSGIFAFEC